MKKLLTSLLVLCMFSACSNRTNTAVENEHIVKIKVTKEVQQVLKNKNYKKISKNTYLIKGDIKDLQDSGALEYSEPNYIWNIVNTPNDPKFNKLWGMDNKVMPGVDINAIKAWGETKGDNNIKIMVIDTGIDYNHPDLKDNIWTNKAEAEGVAGVDDDNNGYIDDVHGYDFKNNDSDPMDDHGHGTHCSGTIGAIHNNDEGVAGVMNKVTIVGCKFLGSDGGTTEGAIKCIDYGVKLGVDIMSNSWGGGGHSEALKEAIERANEAGILFTAAAGNSGTNNDSAPHYPSNYQVANVISVASHTNRNQLSSFSCYGKNTVHIAAPGSDIVSTVLGGAYDSYSGTSMATPHVSGALGLLLSVENGLSIPEIKERLMATSVPVRSFKSKIIKGGRLDTYNLIMDIRPERTEPNPDAWVTAELPASWESAHPYADKEKIVKQIKVLGAKYIRLVIKKADLENKYDFIKIKSGNEVVDSISGIKENYITSEVEGEVLNFEFTSDNSQTRWGFVIEEYQYQ